MPIKGVTNLDYVIEMLGIRKEFGNFVANNNITLQLKQGEIHALLGENGAGKSTLMNVLLVCINQRVAKFVYVGRL